MNDKPRFAVPMIDPRPTMPAGVILPAPVAGMGTGVEDVRYLPVQPLPVGQSDQFVLAMAMINNGTGGAEGRPEAERVRLARALRHLVDHHPRAGASAVWDLSLGQASQAAMLIKVGWYATQVGL